MLDRFKGNQKVPLEPWLGLVVSLADGQHTIGELVLHIARSYMGHPPDDLETTIESVVERLIESEVIKLSDKKVELPYYLSIPEEEQNSEKAKKQMLKDGYILH